MGVPSKSKCSPVGSFHPGDTAYLIHSNRFIREVTILRVYPNRCSVRFTDVSGGIQVWSSRLYRTQEEAAQQLPSRRNYHWSD